LGRNVLSALTDEPLCFEQAKRAALLVGPLLAHRGLLAVHAARLDALLDAAAPLRDDTALLNARDAATAADSVTTVRVAEGHDAREVKRVCHERYNVSLGGGLGKLDGRCFRVGHMGDVNEATVLGALACTEASLAACAIPYASGLDAAVRSLAQDAGA